MEDKKVIVTFGINDKEFSYLEGIIDEKKIRIEKVKSPLDFISYNYFLSIGNLEKITELEMEKLQRFYKEIDGNLSQKIFLGNINKNIIKKLTTVSIINSFEEFRTISEELVLKAYSKAKRAESNTETVLNILRLLNELNEENKLTTKELSIKLDKNENTVKRYINMLNLVGINITYDYNLNCWSKN